MSVPGLSCIPGFSPQYFWSQVDVALVQQELRNAFGIWGLPSRVRVDNGNPWGSKGDWPTVLALWLIGLGIEVIWNPPRQPQKNGVVERSQGTAKRWGEPQQCNNVSELQERLDESDRLQRDAYPYVQGRSRTQVWPGLKHSGRDYREADEERQWRLDRVLEHMSGYVVVRRVDCSGKVSLYDRLRYVGVKHAGQTVTVVFDPQRREWVFADNIDRQIRSQPAEEIETERIRTLWAEYR